jgi:protein phosphatase
MTQRFDIIGDIHGCWEELSELMDKLGHRWSRSAAIHEPANERQIIFLGDITDRGYHSLACYAYAKMMVEAGHALWVMGNHDNKLMRFCDGRNVQRSHGLERTVREIEQAGADKREMYNFLKKLPYHLKLDEGRLIAVHGAWCDELATERSDSGKMRSWCLYAPTAGKKLPNGMPDRIDWVSQRVVTEESPWIVYGHQPYKEARLDRRTVGIDTSCVFGGKLTALRWPEMELVDIPAKRQYDTHPTAGGGDA